MRYVPLVIIFCMLLITNPASSQSLLDRLGKKIEDRLGGNSEGGSSSGAQDVSVENVRSILDIAKTWPESVKKLLLVPIPRIRHVETGQLQACALRKRC